ncbi:hypothetical protein E4T88_17790, partial [Dysgonomonas mossii]
MRAFVKQHATKESPMVAKVWRSNKGVRRAALGGALVATAALLAACGGGGSGGGGLGGEPME